MISTRRLVVLAVVILIPVLVVLARSAQIQILLSAPLSAQARYQQMLTYVRQSPRGTIFDRDGNVLAVSQRAYMIRIDTGTISDTYAAASMVAPVVLRPMDEVRQRIQVIIDDRKLTTPTLPTILYANLSPQTALQLTTTIAANKVAGISVERSWVRIYPQGPIAGPALGFVSLQPTGYSGVEGYYDDRLKAQLGVLYERGATDIVEVTPTQKGATLILTLDSALQNFAEKRLSQAISEYEAVGGTILVMDTHSGAILASASAPGYDPNAAMEIANSPDAKRLHDPAVSDPYEPGSVIKLLTVAAGFEEGVITKTSTYFDSGKYVVGGKTIRNSDLVAHGKVDIEYMLAESLNVVAAQIAADLGPERFYGRFKLFGMGSTTGVDLGNEAVGRLRTPADSDWSVTDLATNSYGQGMTATPLQVLSAMNAIANNGVLVRPYIVQQYRTDDGQVVTTRPADIQRVISPENARVLRDIMTEATRKATPAALIKGYSVAGKTGTADWYLRGLKQETTIVTYVGFVPADEPRITILVKLDQPRKSRWAAATTIPVFHDVAERACLILAVPPNIVQEGSK